MRGRSAGFTLVELVVTTALLMVAMLLASRMLLESQLEMQLRTVELQNPTLRFATQRLRHDIESAAGVVALTDEWREGGLRLRRADGGRVTWASDGSDLVRTASLPGDDGEGVRQTVLRGLGAWQWRRVAPATVDVHLQVRLRQGTGPVALSSRRSWLAAGETRDLWLRVALRGAG